MVFKIEKNSIDGIAILGVGVTLLGLSFITNINFVLRLILSICGGIYSLLGFLIVSKIIKVIR